MTEDEMRWRLQNGEDMKYYKLAPDGKTIMRKTARETALFIQRGKCTCNTLDEFCPKSFDHIHSNEWWDGVGPCAFCGMATCPACDPTTGEHP